jgi:hypothetical protein
MAFPNFTRLPSPALSVRVGRFLLGAICLLAAKVSVCQAGSGYAGKLEAPDAEVLKAVHLVVDDPIVYGTCSYEKEKQRSISGPITSTGSRFVQPARERRRCA